MTRIRGRNAFESQLNGGITSGTLSFLLDSATGLTGPTYLCIDPENPTKREYIRVASVATNTLSGVTRGLDGSAAGAQSHDSGTVVRAVPVHQWLDVIFDDIEANAADIASHVGSTSVSDHPEATAGVRGFMSAADKAKLDGIAAGAEADHGELAGLTDDDHTQYHNDARAVTWHDADDHSAASITESQISDLDHNDPEAIHDNVAGEINAVTVKGSPHEDDLVLVEDSEDTFAKKKATLGSIVSALTEVDHGALTGLGDDDHTQYLLKAGGTMSGPILLSDGSLGAPGIAFQGDADMGFYRDTAFQLRWGVSGVNGGALMGTGVRAIDGTVSAPPYSFLNDADTGLYRVGTNILGFATAGAAAMTLEASGAARFSDGSAAAPGISFINDADTGFYLDAGTIRYSTFGTFGGYLYNGGIRVADGSSPATPGFAWANDADTGLYRPATNTLGFAAAGTNVARMIDGGSASSLFIQDGLTAVGDQTTLRIARGSGGTIVPVGYHSSSLAHKRQVANLSRSKHWSPEKFELLRPITYVRKGGPDAGMREFSFGAEELDEISPMLTTGGSKSKGESVSLTGVLAVTVDYVQHLAERVAALEAV